MRVVIVVMVAMVVVVLFDIVVWWYGGAGGDGGDGANWSLFNHLPPWAPCHTATAAQCRQGEISKTGTTASMAKMAIESIDGRGTPPIQESILAPVSPIASFFTRS